MKILFQVLIFTLLALPVLAQNIEIQKAPTGISVSKPGRLKLDANGSRMVVKDSSGIQGILAFLSDVTAATGGAVTTVNSKSGPTVTLVKGDIGLGNVDNTSDANKPVSTAQQTALNGKEPTVTGGTTVQFYRGDKSWQTLTGATVGLGNVDNTSDANKPVSTAQQTALNGKENSIALGTSSQFWRGDKTWQMLNSAAVGLGNVDNTADANKPVSTPQQTALNAKADVAGVFPATNVAAYGDIAAVPAPATGFIKFITVGTDSQYTEVQDIYIKKPNGKYHKVALFPSEN